VKHRSRVVPGILIGGLVLAGGGSVIAASGGSSSTASSAKDQYCPPNSPGGGNPQGGPGNNCGNPPDKCPNGDPKPPDGNCGNPPDKCPNGNPKPPDGNCGKKPGSQGEKKGKKARFHVKRTSAKRCYTRKFKLRVSVANKGKGRKVHVYKDGRRVRSTGKKKFTVTWKVGRLSPGVHKLKLRVKGSDGKWRTRTVKFRRC
jgi:hypothetical protein